MRIVLVSAKNFQPYILDNIHNLLLHENNDITVLTERSFFPEFTRFPNISLVDCKELDDGGFEHKSRLDKQSREGFWHLCSLRFFYLHAYMEKYQVKNIVHLENDVPIYLNLDTIQEKFVPDKISLPFINLNEAVPSLVHVPTSELLRRFLEDYDPNLNDMYNFALGYKRGLVEILPIWIENPNNEETKALTNFSKYGVIFDGARIGQYLGGIDPRNTPGDTRGYHDKMCQIDYRGQKFYWVKKNNLYFPHAQVGEKLIPIVNLHIHSKKVADFMSDHPKETKFIPLEDDEKKENARLELIKKGIRLEHNYRWIYDKIKDAKVIFDVGARDCFDSVSLQKQYNCEVHAFECNPDTIPICIERLSGTTGISFNTVGLLDQPGNLVFKPFDPEKYNNTGASSFLEIDFTRRDKNDSDYGKSNVQKEVMVNVTTLDLYVEEKKLDKIDILCMDTQETELKILQGGVTLLLDKRIKNIVLEVSPTPTYKGGCSSIEIHNFLTNLGYVFKGEKDRNDLQQIIRQNKAGFSFYDVWYTCE